ncbi:MAG: phosphate acyltransferase [Candidatus Tenebribacter burtonii]|jgi:phosphate butyryltransferase|nr:phosphate acyltransferase [Candidatus Tenebribacter burtonii]
MAIKKLEDLIELVKTKSKKRVVVAYGQDKITILATKKAIDLKFAEFTLIGDQDVIKTICADHDIDPNIYTIIHEPDEIKSGKKAMTLLNHGKGDVLMKGIISTDKLLRCIIDKENGIMIPKATLSHISIAEIPNYHKLLIFTDAAFIPRPNIDQKISMTRYVIDTARKIGVKRPKVAIISFSEKTNPKIPTAVDGAFISKMADRNQIKNADIDGPLSIDLAIDPKSLHYKGVKSCVEGDADCLVFPFLEVANVFYKSLTYFAQASMVTYIVGTKVPTTLSSRTDTLQNKLYSLAFACLMADKDKLSSEEE